MIEVQDIFTFDSNSRYQSTERLTPHKLTIMCLTYEYHQLLRVEMDNKDVDMSLSHSEDQALTDKDKRCFMVLLLDLLQCPDMDLKSLRYKIDKVIKNSILEAVYSMLASIAKQGVKPLQDFLEQQVVQLLAVADDSDGDIMKDSIMGLYIRRMVLAYNEMSFSQVVDMSHKVKIYYEAGFPENKEDNSRSRLDSLLAHKDLGPLSLSHLENRSDSASPEPLDSMQVFSRKQAEYFMARQAQMMGHNQWEALTPDLLQQRIHNILSANPDIAEAHFLSYMNNLRVKEYCTSLHSLYHYFDRKACSTTDSVAPKKKSGTAAPAASDEVAMRYAALNLASLQFRFGNIEECKAALQEAIMLAQEGNDQICLQHALVWLNLLGETHTGTSQLERSIKKTIDLSLPNLTVHGLNCLNRELGLSTETPARVIHYFSQSHLITCMLSSCGLMAAGCAQRAAMWNLYGKRHLISLDSHVVLHLDTSIGGVYYNGQAVCIAVCNLAQQHADMGDYAAANEILNYAVQQFPAGTSEAESWQACQQRIAFTRSVLNGRLREASQALVNLQAVDPVEAKIREPMLLREKGQVTDALQCLLKLLAECEQDNSEYSTHFRCRVLLELSSVYSCTGESTSAVTYVTDCIARAASHHLELLESIAVAHLVYIQLNMDLAAQALSRLESRLLRILTHGSAFDKARVLHLYARCKVAAAETLCKPNSKKEELQSAASIMLRVAQLYHSMEAHLREKDAHHFQAMLHHVLMTSGGQGSTDKQHHQEERNRCARQFKVLDKLYPTLQPGGVPVL